MHSVMTQSRMDIRSVLFQIIRQCNYCCFHCSQDAPHIGQEMEEPVPLETVRSRLSALKQMGLQRVRFTGGEPLLHPELLEIVSFAKELSLNTSIITNGALLRKHGGVLARAGIDSIWISLYGSSADAYAELAGRNAPVESLCDAIKVLAASSVKVGIYCTLSQASDKLDFSLLDKLISQGVSQIKFMQLMEQGRQIDTSRYDFVLTRRAVLERIRDYADGNPAVRVGVSMRSGQRQEFIKSGFRPQENLGCTAGTPDSWSIPSDGALKPCCLMISEKPAKVVGSNETSIPLHFSSSSERKLTLSQTKAGMCPALPRYGAQSIEQFICPLAYATA